ncbi:MAG: winged helix-turn-helix domain-containing protein [Burkholderiales bacterium]|nr:winged helix-turn-helix domain-containing protein [Burkholderiales bacterium]
MSTSSPPSSPAASVVPNPGTSAMPDEPGRVGDFALNIAANELIGADGRAVRIEPRLMALLVRLARTPGVVVSRETLIDEVWSRRMVNDEVLSRAIADLRVALGDDSRAPRYIETIPKSGYRLIAAVNLEAVPSRAPVGAPRRRAHWAVWMAAGLAALMVATAAWIVTLQQPAAKRDRTDWEPVLTAATREARPLTASLGQEIGPRLSPDGRRVLYSQIEGGRATLMLLDPAQSAAQVLSGADENVLSAAFMPDGQSVVYRARAGAACLLRLWTAQGMREIAQCTAGEPARIDVSPDGKWIVRSAVHRDSLPAGLALQALGNGELRQLTTPSISEGEDAMPRFSPDGTQIAFVRGSSSARSIWLVPVAGGDARKVSPLSGLTYGLAWVPDGKALLVAADWFGFRALNWLDLRDGSGRLLGARGARAPDLVAGRLVYENAQFQANLFRVSTRDSTAPTPLHPSTRYTSQPVYSPDGTSLAFVSNREGLEAIYVASGGGAARKLPLPDSHRYMRPTWSADGRSIYAIRIPAMGDKLAPQQAVRITLADAAVAVLPVGDKVSFVSESLDGRWLYVGEREERLMRLWRAPLDAPGRQERLPTPLVGDLKLSANRLAYTQSGLAGITVCTLDGRTCELKRVPTGASHDDHWALTDGAVYFVDGLRDERRLKRHDLKRDAVTILSAVVPSTLGAGLAIHPAESEFIVAREQAPAIDLMTATVAAKP